MSSAANTNERAEAEVKQFPQPQQEAPAPASKVTEPAVELKPAPRKRSRRFALMALVPALLLVGGTYVWVTGGRYEETENANLRQARIAVTSEVAGRIVQVDIQENQTVKQGETLFVIDQEPYRIALAQADASLGAARLKVEELRAAYSQAIASQRVSEEEVKYFQSELDRQSELTRKGVGTAAALDSARRDLIKANEELSSAKEQVAGALAALGGSSDIETDKHPTVLAALAERDKALFNLSQATIKAAGDGVVYQAASIKPGQFVTIGTPLFTLVETGDTWVDANFKETQLTHMKVGQEAEITLDTFPNKPLKAVVDSIGAGTGAEFSILPAQNATGNWVKVTQRIPVRLKVESSDADLLLRSGMSATVTVDTGKARGFASLFGSAFAGE
ncbi:MULTISPECIES: HlyD family secretion protein [Mesorhizobium]|uniref:HlyD family secretion protein n=1 Tax=Mesorhizobium denitrificans TaxID=2294114 RepID=A0A371XH82_9HYPH|nr:MULTISPECIES: HlyD family secretion protein [Mesorhizobium]RFC68589.1 HlyD family secretion protein [Mesorhizobium denitrificans]